jgi:hypothetical protein
MNSDCLSSYPLQRLGSAVTHPIVRRCSFNGKRITLVAPFQSQTIIGGATGCPSREHRSHTLTETSHSARPRTLGLNYHFLDHS